MFCVFHMEIQNWQILSRNVGEEGCLLWLLLFSQKNKYLSNREAGVGVCD